MSSSAPTPRRSAYRKLQREYVDLKDRLVENRDQPAVSADGAQIELLANVNSLADAEARRRVGATGVGLYRTEYLFLTHPTCPTRRSSTSLPPGHRGVARTGP